MAGKRKFPYRQIVEPDMAPYVLAAIDVRPMEPETGHYATGALRDIATQDEAELRKRNIYNAARRLGYSVTCKVEVVKAKPGSGELDSWTITFTPIDKKIGRAYVLQKYGDNPANWPYAVGRKKN